MHPLRTIDANLLRLKEIQLTLRDRNPGWFRRRVLQVEAVKVMDWRAFDACLDAIREGRAAEWAYLKRGRTSAYCLRKLEGALPERLRPSKEDHVRFMRSEIRQHVLATIDLALEAYRLAQQRGPPEYELRLSVGGTRHADYEAYSLLLVDAVNPFVRHLLSMVRRGEFPLPRRLVPPSGFEKEDAQTKVQWLLDLQAWMI